MTYRLPYRSPEAEGGAAAPPVVPEATTQITDADALSALGATEGLRTEPLATPDANPAPAAQGGTERKGADTPPAAPATLQTPASLAAQLRELALAEHPGLVLPEGDDAKTVFQALRSNLTPQLHPEALRIQNALSSGKTLEQYYEERAAPQRMLAMSNEDLVREHMMQTMGKTDANPNGVLSPEEINESVQAMKSSGNLAIEAGRLKMAIQQDIQKRATEDAQQAQGARPDLKDPQVLQKMHTIVQTQATALLKDDQFFGISASTADGKAAIQERAKALFTPNDQGVTPFHEMVNTKPVKMALALDLLESGGFDARVRQERKEVSDSWKKFLGQVPPSEHNATPPAGALSDAIATAQLGQPG